MKKIFLTVVVSGFAVMASAQFVYDYLKAADGYYEKGDYFSAAQYYEKYFGDTKSSKGNEYNPYSPQTIAKKKSTARPTKW